MTAELPSRFEPNTAVQLVAPILFVFQAAILWVTVRPRGDRAGVNLWCLGSMMAAVGLMLIALRDLVPDVTSYTLGNLLVAASYLARISALRHFLGRPPPARQAFGLVLGLLLFGLVYHVLFLWGSARLRVSFSLVFWTLGASCMAWWARRVVQAHVSRSAQLMAGVEFATALVLALYTLTMMSGQLPAVAVPSAWQGLVLSLAIGISALYGNLGYLGLQLDRVQKLERAAREGEQRQNLLREGAEKDAADLRAVLHQRDQLSAERDTLLRVLTHEIRQPLHSAGGALESIRLSTEPGSSLPAEQLRERVLRAEQVLASMRNVLDNVLSAALLLKRSAPPPTQDTELDILLKMTLLDLPETERARVRLLWRSSHRSLAVEPNLLRLALRNLLRNALVHGGAQSQVQLCVEDGDTAQHVRFTVADDGPGMAERALQFHNRAAQPAADQGHADPFSGGVAVQPEGGGLGLQIVRRVAALHGGRVRLKNLPQRGLAVELELPVADH